MGLLNSIFYTVKFIEVKFREATLELLNGNSNVLGHFVQTFSLIFLQQLKKLIELVTIQTQITQIAATFLFPSLRRVARNSQ